jgi:hypothetical protein
LYWVGIPVPSLRRRHETWAAWFLRGKMMARMMARTTMAAMNEPHPALGSLELLLMRGMLHPDVWDLEDMEPL